MTREELIEKQKKELLEFETVQNIEINLPIAPKRIFNADNLKEFWITYEANNIDESLEIINKFELVPCVIYKNACTSVKPQELLKENEKEDKKSWFFNSPFIDLDRIYGYNTTGKIIFFSKYKDQILRVSIEIKNLPTNWKIDLIVEYNRSKVVSFSRKNSLFPNSFDNKIQWYSSEESARYSYFWSNYNRFLESNFKIIKEEKQ